MVGPGPRRALRRPGRGPGKRVSVVVHEFRHAEGTTLAEIWSAERGASVFYAHVPLAEFTIAFAAALRRMRSTMVDPAGMLLEYPSPFPQSEFEWLERRAARFGYHPLPLSEIEHRAASSE